MFSQFRNKLSTIFTNNTRLKRSESVKVQSKAKILTDPTTRQSSSSKQSNKPIQITPKKPFNHNIQLSPPQTIHKDFNNNRTNVCLNNHEKYQCVSQIITNKKWVDAISDVAAQDDNQLLLPDQEQSKQLDAWNSASILNMSTLVTAPCRQVISDNLFQDRQQAENKISESKVAQASLSLVNKEEKLSWFPDALSSQGLTRQATTEQNTTPVIQTIKQSINNLQKDKTSHFDECMICGQSIRPLKKNTILLSCTHRIHEDCAKAMKWKNIYKCNICERRSFRARKNKNI